MPKKVNAISDEATILWAMSAILLMIKKKTANALSLIFHKKHDSTSIIPMKVRRQVTLLAYHALYQEASLANYKENDKDNNNGSLE